MPCPSSLQIALKEWASVCSALESGRQMILLRKGGIYEAGGEFEVENRQFLLFPTYLHQKPEVLKPAEHARLEPRNAEPAQVRLSAMGDVTDILQLHSRAQMDRIEEEHIWTPPLIDLRFNYRPENPLYLLLVRVYRLPQPTLVENTLAYGGCKSWVPLAQPIDTRECTPVLDDRDYEARRSRIIDRIAKEKQ
ncbi:MAG TPA: DUF1802 family protein [Tepidisphaeraceae bacterium]|nr:DUF1802 family protein [Tepidisphaeraceae bacterium]